MGIYALPKETNVLVALWVQQCSRVNFFSKCDILLKFGRSTEKVMACISPDYDPSLKFGRNRMKIVGPVDFKIWPSGILQCTQNDPKLNSKNQTRKVLYICSIQERESLNFTLFRSVISCFQNIAHFWIYPLAPMLKFQSATKSLILADRQNISMTLYSLISAYDCLIYHKVWLRSDENWSSVLKFLFKC